LNFEKAAMLRDQLEEIRQMPEFEDNKKGEQ
jgi:protein-arginine kinase activator protein McsA